MKIISAITKIVAFNLALAVSLSSHAWTYTEQFDKMRNEKTKYATAASKNSHTLNFPYGSDVRLKIVFRKKDSKDLNVMLITNRGQFYCSESCSINLKFDNDAVESYLAQPPEDGTTDTLFLTSEKVFYENIKKAKKLTIEVPFYDYGKAQYDFDIKDLKFDVEF